MGVRGVEIDVFVLRPTGSQVQRVVHTTVLFLQGLPQMHKGGNAHGGFRMSSDMINYLSALARPTTSAIHPS